MANTNELRAAFARKGLTQAQVAKAIGISSKTMTQRMKTGVFGSDEIQVMIDLLDIDDPVAVFFAKSVT